MVERKKLSPEARKQTRASESPKITSTNQFLCFPSFVFTIALMIERKKLSPEARKQTRASESLKITSKVNVTFPNMFDYYSPGDRAQKKISGGAKTNESF